MYSVSKMTFLSFLQLVCELEGDIGAEVNQFETHVLS